MCYKHSASAIFFMSSNRRNAPLYIASFQCFLC